MLQDKLLSRCSKKGQTLSMNTLHFSPNKTKYTWHVYCVSMFTVEPGKARVPVVGVEYGTRLDKWNVIHKKFSSSAKMIDGCLSLYLALQRSGTTQSVPLRSLLAAGIGSSSPATLKRTEWCEMDGWFLWVNLFFRNYCGERFLIPRGAEWVAMHNSSNLKVTLPTQWNTILLIQK